MLRCCFVAASLLLLPLLLLLLHSAYYRQSASEKQIACELMNAVQHQLAIIAIYRNECKIMREWLTHHIAQGFDHFFLISNDRHPNERCNDVLEQFHPFVTRFVWPHTPISSINANSSNQLNAYAHTLPSVAARWVLISDLDEFVFAPRGTTAAETVANVAANVSQICMAWVRFGSSNLTSTPSCVTESNVWREPMVTPARLFGKCMTRRSALTVRGLHVHRAIVNQTVHGSRNCMCADLATPCSHVFPSSLACRLVADKFVSQRLFMFHYQVQSQEHIRDVSMRGDVNIKDMSNTRRDERYWHEKESRFNRVEDRTLARMSICRRWVSRPGANATFARNTAVL